MNIAIGVRLRSELGFNQFWIALSTNFKEGVRLIPSVGYGSAEAARDIFRRFLSGNESHLLMLDDDAEIAPGTLTRLMARGLPVIGALTWTRNFPPMPTLWRGESGVQNGYISWRTRTDDVIKFMQRPEIEAELQEHQVESAFVLNYDKTDALSRSDKVGFHCLLIQRDVLTAIGEPYCEADANGVHEDFDWSKRAILAGFDLYVDKGVFAGHVKVHSVGPLDFGVWMQALQLDADKFAALEDAQNGKKN